VGLAVSRNSHSFFQRLLTWVFTDQVCWKVTIAALPNEILLDIFCIYLDLPQRSRPVVNAYNPGRDSWHTLADVCQRWRDVVFAMPRYLDLQFDCTNETPMKVLKEILEIWPIPITISCYQSGPRVRGVLNIAAVLKRRDRLRGVCFRGNLNPLLTRFAAALSKPFPELTSLQLSSADNDNPHVLPDSFLGGFAPRLRSLKLHGVPFPSPRKLLLSATDLVTLRFERIPYSGPGYISPEEIVACLSTLTKLEEFALEFRCYGHPSTQHPVTRSVLPALTSLRFEGARAYLEDLLSRTDLPLLDNVDITSTYRDTSHSPLLSELVSRFDSLGALHCAEITFDERSRIVNVALSRSRGVADSRTLRFRIECHRSQLLPLSQFWDLALPPFPNLEHLYIHSAFPLHSSQYFAESAQWLELLRQFTSVENLHLSPDTAERVAGALQDLFTRGVTGVLPALQNIFLSGHWGWSFAIKYVEQFVAAIRPFGRSVSVQKESG